LKKVLRLDGRDGFVASDVGCYGLDGRIGGQMIERTQYGMGSGSGLASGFGKMAKFGYDQPIVALCGDSTFFHAAMPAIANAVHHQSDVIIVILDNKATAMTGFQSHPGLSVDAVGDHAIAIDIEKVCRSLGCQTEVADPFDNVDAEEKLLKLIDQKGVKAIIFRRECGLFNFRKHGPHYRVWVNQDKCLGEECGCNQYCMHSFKCPALTWDRMVGKAKVDEALCTGCGFCVNICPGESIQREEIREER
jgi:indolepyruvate ferredoxin oxidoreductase alpha subunit